MHQVMVEYFGNNDYRDYLAHHGIMGMSWGHRNGPPYPLDAGDHSAAEKKAGWRQSLSSSGRADLKRKWKSKERADYDGNRRARYGGMDDEEDEKTSPAKRTLKEVLAARKEKSIESKKQRIADRAVESEDMDALKKDKVAKMFTTDELKDIASRIDERVARKELIASKSKNSLDERKKDMADRAVNSADMSEIMKPRNNKLFSAEELNEISDRVDARAAALNRASGRSNLVEGLFGKNRQSDLDKANASKILKNADRYTTKELQEAAEKFAAKQKLKDAQRDARLNGIKSLVEKGAAITKSVSEITNNVKTAKKAIEEITGKELPGASDAINKILNSGDRNRIDELSKTVEFDADKYKKAASSIKAKDDYDKLFQANQRANEPSQTQQQSQSTQQQSQSTQQQSQGKQQKQQAQQKQDGSKDQKIKNTYDKIQNESKPTEPKQESAPSGSAYDRMMDSWRSAKVDSSSKTSGASDNFADTRMDRMAGAMRAGSKNSEAISKAMDAELRKYDQMTQTKDGGKTATAKAIANLSRASYSPVSTQTDEQRRTLRAIAEWGLQNSAQAAERARTEQAIASASATRSAELKKSATNAKRQDTRRLNKAIANWESSGRPEGKTPAHEWVDEWQRQQSSGSSESSSSLSKASTSSTSKPSSSSAQSSGSKSSKSESDTSDFYSRWTGMFSNSESSSSRIQRAAKRVEEVSTRGASSEAVKEVGKAAKDLLGAVLGDADSDKKKKK